MVESGALTYGRTWDGIYPFAINGTPGPIGAGTLTLNNAFWTRIDYLFTTAASYDMTVLPEPGILLRLRRHQRVRQYHQHPGDGIRQRAVATRYPLSSWPNVQWFFGDDDNVGTNDADFTNMLTGIRAAGDTRSMIAMENEPQVNEHIQFYNQVAWNPGGFGVTNATYNWCYELPRVLHRAGGVLQGVGDVPADPADLRGREMVRRRRLLHRRLHRAARRVVVPVLRGAGARCHVRAERRGRGVAVVEHGGRSS